MINRKVILLFSYILILLLLVACSQDNPLEESKYTVSGTIFDENQSGISGVSLVFEGENKESFGTATTDSEGNWVKSGLAGDVTIIPLSSGYSFEPSSRLVSREANDINFTAVALVSKIVFTRRLESGSQIFIMNPDGTEPARLTDSYDNFLPKLSPDGRRIVYVNDSDDNDDIMIMDSDGNNPYTLIGTSEIETRPSWSPDSNKIAYMEVGSNWRKSNIILFDLEDNKTINITDDEFFNACPAWSPDGSKIAFLTDKSDRNSIDLYIMDTDGRNERFLTTVISNANLEAIEAVSLSWTPDGEKIVFPYIDVSEEAADIYIVEVDTGNIHKLTDTSNIFEGLPSVSPDGTKIAYIGDGGDGQDIYIMDINGGNLVQITNTPDNDEASLDWSPYSNGD